VCVFLLRLGVFSSKKIVFFNLEFFNAEQDFQKASELNSDKKPFYSQVLENFKLKAQLEQLNAELEKANRQQQKLIPNT
jgi:hypothetical protein